MFRKAVAGRQDVTMKLDAALWHARRAAGEGDQRWIVAAGVGGRQRIERSGAGLQLALPMIAVIFDDVLHEAGLFGALAEVADEPAVDDRMADLGPIDHGRDFA